MPRPTLGNVPVVMRGSPAAPGQPAEVRLCGFCGQLLTSIEVVTPVPALAGPQLVPFSVPNDRLLLGVRFYQQVVAETRILGGLNAVAFGHGGAGRIGL
jgi:hypothetical protein